MNRYKIDGARWLYRATTIIPDHTGKHEDDPEGLDFEAVVEESILYFALGIEKLLKGILYDINPLFIYEKIDFENIAGVLYRSRMTVGLGNAFDSNDKSQKISRHVHTGMTSLHRAKHFSQTALENFQTIKKLFEMRGIVAHAVYPDLKKNSLEFVQKTFYPLVHAFAKELRLKSHEVFSDGSRVSLGYLSENILKKENSKKEMEKLVERHTAIYNKRKDDEKAYQSARIRTNASLVEKFAPETFVEEQGCPVCGEPSVLICARDFELVDGQAIATGAYVTGLRCFFCDLEINGYEQIEYFDLEKSLYENQ